MIKKLKNEFSIIKNNFEQCKTNKEKQIKDLNERIRFLNEKVKVLEQRKNIFKEYMKLKEKGKKYDELYDKYNKIKKYTMEKWNLTEQEYLQIISKKDDDIQQLKKALAQNENINEESDDESFRNFNNNFCDHIITTPLKKKIKREFTFSE